MIRSEIIGKLEEILNYKKQTVEKKIIIQYSKVKIKLILADILRKVLRRDFLRRIFV